MSQAEAREPIEVFWRNLYLRGQVLFDESGAIGAGAYLQPDTGVPASRAFVIGADQTVVLSHFSYDPHYIIDTIYGLLGSVEGDFDADNDVDTDDFDRFESCFTGPGGYRAPGCVPGDFDGDNDVDCHDWYAFVGAWTPLGDPPGLGQCSQVIHISLSRTELSWTAAPGATGYDVVQGDLQALRDGGDFSTAVDGCLADDTVGNTLPYADDPLPGSGLWVLVRGVGGSVNMTYDCLEGSLVTSRDPGINAAVTACP
jgi:hypothetical protein